jgi:hypothetical protein
VENAPHAVNDGFPENITGNKKMTNHKTKQHGVQPEQQSERIERLFNDFFDAASTAVQKFEQLFLVNGMFEQLFGSDGASIDEQKALLKQCYAWQLLEAVFEYATNGVLLPAACEGPDGLVLDANEVLMLVNSYEAQTSKEWDDIIAMADGRFSLDDGVAIDIYKVALLAGVDLRTARNAASSGELVTFKNDSFVFVEPASARSWLMGRKNFKPTVVPEATASLRDVRTAVEFAAFLVAAREKRGQDFETDPRCVAHPAVTAEALKKLEQGVFELPLDAVFPLAEFYALDAKAFLETVMRVFYRAEMDVLTKRGEEL